MKRVLALAVLVACMPTANAQDKGKAEITHNAEFRVRDTFTQNESGNKDSKSAGASGETAGGNGIEHRFKVGLGYKANEKFGAHLTLLHGAQWGQGNTETLGEDGTVDTTKGGDDNFMAVNEAYGTWMISEDFNVKFGRMNFGFGDGTVMAVNDWESTPYSFEGVSGTYQTDFGTFTPFAFKYREYSFATANSSSDAEHNAYGLVFDLKKMPDMVKMITAHVIQDTADAVGAGTTVAGLQGQNILRYGVGLGLNFNMVDFRAAYNAYNGDNTPLATPLVKRDAKGTMMEFELGFNFTNFMGSRLFALYHQDSGDSESTDDKDGRYDSYFYEKHANAGLMDIVGWGNLTDLAIGYTAKPGDSTDVGLAYHMLSRTETKDGLSGSTLASSVSANDKEKLGNEIDAWAEHRYEGGFAMVGRLGYFMPGDALKDSTVNRKDAVTQVMIEAKMTF